jgi:hypothetical protein
VRNRKLTVRFRKPPTTTATWAATRRSTT